MIARVSLEIALRKEFDYLIPPGLAGQIEVGSRVQVPFGARKILGTVTALAEESALAKLKPILKVIGTQSLVTPKVPVSCRQRPAAFRRRRTTPSPTRPAVSRCSCRPR